LLALTGKIALITGSSQGLGLFLARGLGHAGAAIVLNGQPEKLHTQTAFWLMRVDVYATPLTYQIPQRINKRFHVLSKRSDQLTPGK
jgi:gluconate 5-dehydrogenase